MSEFVHDPLKPQAEMSLDEYLDDVLFHAVEALARVDFDDFEGWFECALIAADIEESTDA